MATVATRAPKRELGPDWRDALAQAVRRFAVRTWGALSSFPKRTLDPALWIWRPQWLQCNINPFAAYNMQ